ncbi:hypothetical protein IAD21_05851 [Abditibacteriota bacterium]|nr:hypothetical protein IAD21_05851 [Abditibacteriota bacterium]
MASRTLDSPAPSTILETPPPKRGGVTVRSVSMSLFLAAMFGYCIPIVDFKMSNTFMGSMHMPAGAIAVLLALLLVVNPLLRLLSTRLAFTRQETLTVYISCLFSTLVPGRGAENFFVPNILSSFYYAKPENKWLDFLTPYLKPWMVPSMHGGKFDPLVASGWYENNGGKIPWEAWMSPLVAWTALILALHIMHACLGVMLRAQWAQREALAFPLLRLPLELSEESADGKVRFFKNPLVWVGFSISVFIEMLNGLHLYFPDVPAFPLSLPMGQYLTEAPWNQMGNMQVQIFPAIVGISFLLTSEVSFSLWFLHLFSKTQYIAAYMLGYPAASLDAPFWLRGWAKGFVGYQQVGAILAYMGLLVWTGREHWKHIARRAVGKVQATEDEKGEALSYPVAFWGFFLMLTFILGWTIASGVRWEVALLLWAFYLAISLALTRLVAEAGLLFVQTGWMPLGPLAFLVGAGPGHLIDAATAAPAAMISSSLMLDQRGFTLPSFLQGFKLAHDQNIAPRPLLALIFGCIAISFSIGLFSILRMGYTLGGLQMANWWATAAGSQPALHAVGFARGLDTNMAANWFWVGIGAAATIAMMNARARFAWFPLHPLGLIMCVPFAMHAMWISIFLGWISKTLITRFGGTDSARKVTPFFLGLALGGITMVIFWVCVDGWQGRTGHALLPF